MIIYTATYSPYRTAFFGEGSSAFLFAFETVVDAFFLIDIFINFITPFRKVDNNFEYNPKRIAKNYFHGDLTVDLISVFPTQFFEVNSFPLEGGEDSSSARLGRFAKL